MKYLYLLLASFLISTVLLAQIELYSVSYYGGSGPCYSHGCGTIYKFDVSSNTLTSLHDFTLNDGQLPSNTVVQAKSGELYGLVGSGGVYNYGVLYKINPLNSIFTAILHFDGPINGRYPHSYLTLADNDILYGTIGAGGTNDHGVLFKLDPGTDTFTKLMDFEMNTSGYSPNPLLSADNGKLYGTTGTGGAYGNGTIYEFDPQTEIYTKLIDIPDSVGIHTRPFVQAKNGKLYAVATQGGTNLYCNYACGTLVEYDIVTNTLTRKLNFDDLTMGKYPNGTLEVASNGRIYGTAPEGGINGYGTVFEYDPITDVFTTLHYFGDFENGRVPSSGVTQASNGKLYGVTSDGGDTACWCGVLYEYDLITSTYSVLHTFESTTSHNPYYSFFTETCPQKFTQIEKVICNGDSIFVGGGWQTTLGVYYDTLTNICNTDSVVETTIVDYYLTVDNIEICEGDSFMYTGNIYMNPGTYGDTLLAVNGCDSIYLFNLSYIYVDTSVSINNNVLNANISGATYQWLDCDNNYSPINGEINQSYSPTSDGNYAVLITDAVCADTSYCFDISGLYKYEMEENTQIEIYPNPTSGVVYIKGENIHLVEIIDMDGQLLESTQPNDHCFELNFKQFSKDLYILKIYTNKHIYVERVILR